jgi:flagellar biosynthesis GTPase FlhF
MAFSRTAQLATFLALASSSGAFAFAPSHFSSHRRNTATQVAASNNQDGWKKVAGGVASFVAGLGVLAQVAFADPNSVAPVNEAQMVSVAQKSYVSSSNVLLAVGAPTFGGGGSFETLDFSLPSYDEATSGADLSSPKRDVSDLFGSKSNSDDDAVAKEAAKKQAEAEKKQAAEDARAAKEAKAKADAEAKAEKEAQAKADEEAKAAKEAEKEARKVRSTET